MRAACGYRHRGDEEKPWMWQCCWSFKWVKHSPARIPPAASLESQTAAGSAAGAGGARRQRRGLVLRVLLPVRPPPLRVLAPAPFLLPTRAPSEFASAAASTRGAFPFFKVRRAGDLLFVDRLAATRCGRLLYHQQYLTSLKIKNGDRPKKHSAMIV